MGNYVGQPVVRVDGVDKVTGAAVFGGDLLLPNLLQARVLRSPYAHARIVSIDTAAAAALPGVAAVVSGDDVVGILGGEALKDMPFLAIGKVRYAGEPVAAVAAESLEIAEAALRLIQVEYEQLPAATALVTAMAEGAPLVHAEMAEYSHIGSVKPVAGTNICNVTELKKGDPEQGFAEADYVFTDTFRSHIVQHGQIEPHVAIAQYSQAGKLNLWGPNDGPHRLRKDLADALKMPLNKIRIRSTYVGGDFGGKGGLKAEPVAVALAMKTRHRPVKLALTREETFTATAVRHAAVITIKTGVNRDGKLVAREVECVWDTGAYAEKGPTVVNQGTAAAAGPYKIPHVRLKGYCVYTNKVPAGAYRGYGTNQTTWAFESQMDMIAERLGLDPLDIRLLNILRDNDEMPTGGPAMSMGLAECLERAAREIGWQRRATLGPNRGMGIACTVKFTKTPSGSAVFLTLNGDGSLNVLCSGVEVGQGAQTVFAQMAAEAMDIPLERITVAEPDTDTTPYDSSTTSSRATFHNGNAIILAAEDIKKQLVTLAAKLLGCGESELTAAAGRVSRADGSSLTYAEVVSKGYGAGGTILGRGFYYTAAGKWPAPSVFRMYGVNAVEVEVDPETGKINVVNAVSAHDVGTAINPVTCCQQMEGGMVQALGNALLEEVKFKEGRVLNPTFHDYQMPTALDAPSVTALLIEVPHPEGPFGAKGLGEPVLNSAAAATASAVYMATGVRFAELPLTPERVFNGLKKIKPGLSQN
ncbi:MAG: xanthine dehydrogenase family protein molybdopterin-binding subunit [Negativicutes bacterium]|nr:xanthine dehydrogenase family protein molybdopterin-binding subunit [Negativicutes bacterium]